MTNQYVYWNKTEQQQWLQQFLTHFHPVHFEKKSIEETISIAFADFYSSSLEDQNIILHFLSRDIVRLWDEEGVHFLFIDIYNRDHDVQNMKNHPTLQHMTTGISETQSQFLKGYIAAQVLTLLTKKRERVEVFLEIQDILKPTLKWTFDTVQNVLGDFVSYHQENRTVPKPLHNYSIFETFLDPNKEFHVYKNKTSIFLYILEHYVFFHSVFSEKDNETIQLHSSFFLERFSGKSEKEIAYIEKMIQKVSQKKKTI